MENYWENATKESKQNKALKEKYPLLDKKVRRKGKSKWEEGVVILYTPEWSNHESLFIKYSEDDLEELYGLPFQIWDDNNNNWIETK